MVYCVTILRLRIYGTYIVNQKFGLIRISVFRGTKIKKIKDIKHAKNINFL